MTDLLSAASLLLAIMSALYGLWRKDIDDALHIVPPRHPPDRVLPFGRVGGVLYTRALPLAIASVLVALVILPASLGVIGGSFAHTRRVGWRAAVGDYDAIEATLVVVNLGLLALAAHLITVAHRLIKLRRKLNPKREIQN
jgi:hypothetical protein